MTAEHFEEHWYKSSSDEDRRLLAFDTVGVLQAEIAARDARIVQADTERDNWKRWCEEAERTLSARVRELEAALEQMQELVKWALNEIGSDGYYCVEPLPAGIRRVNTMCLELDERALAAASATTDPAPDIMCRTCNQPAIQHVDGCPQFTIPLAAPTSPPRGDDATGGG